jgi:hypothetical protein
MKGYLAAQCCAQVSTARLHLNMVNSGFDATEALLTGLKSPKTSFKNTVPLKMALRSQLVDDQRAPLSSFRTSEILRSNSCYNIFCCSHSTMEGT